MAGEAVACKTRTMASSEVTGQELVLAGAEPAATGVRRDTTGRFQPGGKTANPAGRAGARSATAEPPAFRADGWMSLLTGLGTSAYDKRTCTTFVPDLVDWESARSIWRGDDLAARIIETLPSEMIREGATLAITDADASKPEPGARKDRKRQRMDASDKDRAEAVTGKWDELGMWNVLHEALCYERAYGGAAILVGANDGQVDLTKPLNMKAVRSIDFLTALEPREITPLYYYGDPLAPKYGTPAIYQIQPASNGAPIDLKTVQVQIRKVHESRLIVFSGVRVTRQQLDTGWGDSVLSRAWRVLRDFNLSWGAAGILVADFAQAVYKMKGLNDLLNEDPTDLFKRRIQGMELARSVARAVMIDSEDEFARQQTPVSGLPELLDRFATRLAAAADMPLTLLMGESPAGLNATGASDIRLFYDRVASAQKRKLEPAIRRITQMIFQVYGGEPETWSIEFNPLWQLTEKEQAEARKIQADIDIAYLDRSVVTSDEVRNSRFGGDAYSFDTMIETDAVEPTAEEMASYTAEMSGTPADPTMVGAPMPGKPAMPGAPAELGAGAPVTEIQKQAMNGAQISSLLEVIKAAGDKEISRESAASVLKLAFQIAEADANKLLGPVNFTPVKPEPPAMGGGFGAPKVPGAPPKVTGVTAPMIGKKLDFDPDQARAENGQFGEGGGGSSSGKGGSGSSGGSGSGSRSGELPPPDHFKGAAKTAYATALEVLAEDGFEIDVDTVADYCADRHVAGGKDAAGYKEVRDEMRRRQRRLDYNPDQPRAENGQFGEGGGGASGSGHGHAAGGGAPSASHTSIPKNTQKAYFHEGKWASERTQIHEGYAAKTVAGVPKSAAPVVYMTGGGPASGKTTALIENPAANIPDKMNAAHIDPDSAKGDIPEYVARVAAGDKEAAADVHEESSHMAKEAVRTALADGHDVVYDSTGSGEQKLLNKVAEMRARGATKVFANYATLEVEEAVRRADSRAKRIGRVVDHEIIRETHASVSRTVAMALDKGTFDSLDLYDNNGRSPVHVMSYTRESGVKVHDAGLYEAFKARGTR